MRKAKPDRIATEVLADETHVREPSIAKLLPKGLKTPWATFPSVERIRSKGKPNRVNIHFWHGPLPLTHGDIRGEHAGSITGNAAFFAGLKVAAGVALEILQGKDPVTP